MILNGCFLKKKRFKWLDLKLGSCAQKWLISTLPTNQSMTWLSDVSASDWLESVVCYFSKYSVGSGYSDFLVCNLKPELNNRFLLKQHPYPIRTCTRIHPWTFGSADMVGQVGYHGSLDSPTDHILFFLFSFFKPGTLHILSASCT